MSNKQIAASSKKPVAEVFCVRLKPELIAFLRRLAERERRPVSMQLTVILEELQRRESDLISK